jgi:ribosomal protein S18 acetylase RimI-like enzyme
MSHLLDRPAWNALTGPHAALAQGEARARRYRPGTVPFAAARDASDDSLAALAALPGPGEVMVLVEANPLALPPGMVSVKNAAVVQMELISMPEPSPNDRIEKLNWLDAQEMFALATLTEPGPFTLKAQELGDFYGIRADGRIVAMAGQRMKQVGFTELSGVCTHPDFRGRGLARQLSVFLMHRIRSRGDRPYLHVWAQNTPAIRLYESIGFALRTTMNLAVIQKLE